MQLRVPFDRTISFLNTIPNRQVNESSISNQWTPHYVPPNDHNGEFGEMRAQAVCWLYCWVMRKGGVHARRVFDNIFIIPFGRYPTDAEFHEWARDIRYMTPSSNYENDLAQRLGMDTVLRIGQA